MSMTLLTDLKKRSHKNHKRSNLSMKQQYIRTALSKIQKKRCSYGVQAVLHLILFLILFLAQLAIIPLLMIQVFDTYAFLCLAADNYCTMESQFTLHFHQTVVTFAFYCSLMVSFLTSTMLRWVPWPKKGSQHN